LIERVAKYVIGGDRKKKREDMIDLDYIDSVLKNLIDQIENKKLSNRIRFRIYDFRDVYEKEWKSNIERKKLLLKGERVETEVSLSSKIEENTEAETNDEDVMKEVKRKESVNENNVIGLDLKLYDTQKPNNQIRLKIKNFIDEYFSEKD
jgi:hypothetical protein